MTPTKENNKDKFLADKLREILLREDRAAFAQLEDIVNDPEELSKKVMPFVEERMEHLKENFPSQYEAVVEKMIEQRLATMKDELLETLYPQFGKMIRKYVTHQIQLLKDNIDNTVNKFSFQSIKSSIQAKFFGVKKSDIIITNIAPEIEEIYMINRKTGMLLASASNNNSIDQEVIAGMLTAIKAFGEDAFQKESEDLEIVEYGSYKIFMQNFPSYYFAIVLSGAISTLEKQKLSDSIEQFIDKELDNNVLENENTSEKLMKYFFKTTEQPTQITH